MPVATQPPDDATSAPTRATLLARLKDWNDDPSWREFFDTYWKLIYATALKAGLDDASARDVVQETLVTVARQIRHFEYDPAVGSFKNWLLTTTRWRIADHLRRRCREPAAWPDSQPTTDTGTPPAHRVPDPAGEAWAAGWEQDWRRNLLDAALERVKGRVKPAQFQMFDCFVLKQWPMHEVTRQLGVNAGQVYFAKYKLGRLLRHELEKLERRWK